MITKFNEKKGNKKGNEKKRLAIHWNWKRLNLEVYHSFCIILNVCVMGVKLQLKPFAFYHFARIHYIYSKIAIVYLRYIYWHLICVCAAKVHRKWFDTDGTNVWLEVLFFITNAHCEHIQLSTAYYHSRKIAKAKSFHSRETISFAHSLKSQKCVDVLIEVRIR